MKNPDPQAVAFAALNHVISAKLKLDDAPCSAEAHLNQAIILLQQIPSFVKYKLTDEHRNVIVEALKEISAR